MFVVSFIAVLVVLITYSPVDSMAYVPIAVLRVLVELHSKNGMGTWTCPSDFISCTILYRGWKKQCFVRACHRGSRDRGQ